MVTMYRNTRHIVEVESKSAENGKFMSVIFVVFKRYTAADRVAMHTAKMETFTKVSSKLLSAGQFPVFAMAATFNSSVAPPPYRCGYGITEASTLALLGPTTGFVR
jgi:hypothetical protein